jgi:predicted nucleic acid-binding protein
VREVFTTEHTLAEVEEYAVVLPRRKACRRTWCSFALAALPTTVLGRNIYAKNIPEARKRISLRDPEDVDLLALALHLRIPIWSNDKDFQGLGVDLFTAEQLLRSLGLIR